MQQLSGKDRLIVALDVPTHERAFQLVEQLDNVSFFKVGLELLLAGDLLGFLQGLQERRRQAGGVFIDLKTAGDIGNTIVAMMRQLQSLNVRFLTLMETVPLAITLKNVRTIREARGSSKNPELLMVPVFSNLDEEDLSEGAERVTDVNAYIVERGKKMLDGGCDGLIVSGQAIKACRIAFPDRTIVSPGIRPAWASPDDHKRLTTPREAIGLGADFLVVGRPITKFAKPKEAAQRIIDEIDSALDDRSAGPRSLSKAG